MNIKNLISLADRPQEDRIAIARLGGLARQEQRRHIFKMQRELNALLELNDFIDNYCKHPKSNRIKPTRNLYSSKYSNNLYSAMRSDLGTAYTNYNKEIEIENLKKEKQRKRRRKATNRKYYLKHRKNLRKT